MATKNTNKSTAMSETERLMAELAAARAENEALRAQNVNTGKMGAQISGKGAISLTGLGKWPVTLYREQWERVIAEGVPMVKNLIATRGKDLAVKGLPYTPPADVAARIAARASKTEQD